MIKSSLVGAHLVREVWDALHQQQLDVPHPHILTLRVGNLNRLQYHKATFWCMNFIKFYANNANHASASSINLYFIKYHAIICNNTRTHK